MSDLEPRPPVGPDDMLAFVHIGDLHLMDAKQRNFADFLAIVAQVEIEASPFIDFVVLPGDNADNGKRSQYVLAATALRMLSVPVHAIPGDHDMEQGGLGAFYAELATEPLPKAITVRGVRCLFLDICGTGRGGPDFRLGHDQVAWLAQQLAGAAAEAQPSIVFMHSYPVDLKGQDETAQVNALLSAHDVALVDIGHTHYNELANDRGTIFAATRSTGQIEEGPVGYSIASFDAGVVSWRFKPLDDAFPLVLITSPADHRLQRGPEQAVEGSCVVRALVLGRRPIERVQCRVEGRSWVTMAKAEDGRAWSATVDLTAAETVAIDVRAVDAAGRLGEHRIVAATPRYHPRERPRTGSDEASIGAWPENGIFGTQLGPNRNGTPTS